MRNNAPANDPLARFPKEDATAYYKQPENPFPHGAEEWCALAHP